MEKDFLLFPEANALKDLGFIEPVIAYYKRKKHTDAVIYELFPSPDPTIQIQYQGGMQNSHPELGLISCPTYSQAFKWFREKYCLHISIYPVQSYDTNDYCWSVQWLDKIIRANRNYPDKSMVGTRAKSYEEAEFACIKNLIKIVKEKK